MPFVKKRRSLVTPVEIIRSMRELLRSSLLSRRKSWKYVKSVPKEKAERNILRG
uniref:Uncharacterized protein n=1 Tax=uncultured marine virus TaxID=186617 RepID=A0A0F7L717_9VIRU|nr:hypothetical protein [uncultured marine virus]